MELKPGMGTAQSREGRLDSDEESEPDSPTESSRSLHSLGEETPSEHFKSPSSVTKDEPNLSSMLGSLSLHAMAEPQPLVKLYKHIGGNSASAQWVVADKLVSWEFVREHDEEDEEEDEDEKWRGSTTGNKLFKSWLLIVGDKIKARVDDGLQMHFMDDQMRADFVRKGVWALKFPKKENYEDFVTEFQNCRFENTYFLEATESNKMKVFGKDFMVWSKGEGEDESIWEDAEESLKQQTSAVKAKELKETYHEPSKLNIQSLTMGALDHSFLVSDSGLDVLSNLPTGLHGKGVTIRFQEGHKGGTSPFLTPKKGMLMRGESNMMLLSPAKDGKPHAGGVSQLDIGTGKIVSEWKFEKDGTPITMRDVTNESKGSQLDAGGSTFLGLDDNRLCRWDMRDRNGIVQQLGSPAALNWSEGHQFSRGTNFECFATAGDGAVVVGSRDGKVRLYGTTSMRQAKTAFPGLGSPITHVDVTYDGKWVLATTDTYLILISTVFKDKDGKSKTGFTGRMGNRIAAPRLLKLNPVDYHGGQAQKFHGGQFSWVTEQGKQERNLVVSVGNFTVLWNFQLVKDSHHECYRHQTGLKTCYCYKVVPKDESIIESKFMHDRFLQSCDTPEAPLVVATTRNVSCFNI